jgi:uncharacterized protein
MIKQSCAIVVASFLGTALAATAVVFGSAVFGSTAYAQSADQVLCDRLAADPADPDKPADVKGVGEIAPSDVATAIKFCKVASASSRRAMYELGRAYAASRKIPEAITAWRKAADKGSTAAMVELGQLYMNGSGLPKDTEEAHKLFERAASAGNPQGAAYLASTSNGAASSDPASARALLQKAADANSADAQLQLGVMLANGVGGPKDDVGARALFEKAAAQGDPEAMDWAGNFAESGRGGPKDKDAAKSYYEKAAALGNTDAKAALDRLKCPIVLTTKKGEVWSHMCF